jgi:cyclopropane-fatty-acyl-phospholipid synthase
MQGWWDCEQLDVLFYKVMVAQLHHKFTDYALILRYLKSLVFNLQTLKRSIKVAKVHYDLDNDLYSAMLGPSMAYTCGYWKDAKNLNGAQNDKYDLICRKLSLSPQDHVLELGCGWGGFAKFAAENYGAKMVSVNISEEQVKFAKAYCKGLPVDVYLADYRNTEIYNPKQVQFDKVVSIGMCEHIGHKNYPMFLELAYQQLQEGGLFLLHTIGNNKTYKTLDPWIDKYIFPNGEVPSISQLASVMEKFFVMEDWHNFGADYDKTLMAWHENFTKAWPNLTHKYDERFYRMWVYYLLSCAGTFRAREMQLWQIVLSKGRGQPGYQRVS